MQAQGSLLSPSDTKMSDTLSTAATNPFVKTVIPVYMHVVELKGKAPYDPYKVT